MNEDQFLKLAARALSKATFDIELKELTDLLTQDISLHQRFEALKHYWSESESDNDSRRELFVDRYYEENKKFVSENFYFNLI